jgi:hypothetical protein
MALELFFVSARTNKRQHHYQAKKCACFTRCMKMCSKQKVRLLYASYELRVLCGVPWGSLRGTLGFSAGMNTILCGDRYRSLWGSLHSPPKRHLLPLPPSLPPLHQKKVHAVELIAPHCLPYIKKGARGRKQLIEYIHASITTYKPA